MKTLKQFVEEREPGNVNPFLAEVDTNEPQLFIIGQCGGCAIDWLCGGRWKANSRTSLCGSGSGGGPAGMELCAE